MMIEEEKEKIHGPGKEFDNLFNKASDYFETNVELYKLKALHKTADIASDVIAKLLMIVVFFIFFILLNIGIAYFIGSLIGHTYIGFFILSALYLIIGLILKSNSNNWVKIPTTSMIIKSITK